MAALLINPFPNGKFWPLPNSKSLQTTILSLMKMAEVLRKGRKHCEFDPELNSLPNDNILDMTNLKTFADDKLNIA